MSPIAPRPPAHRSNKLKRILAAGDVALAAWVSSKSPAMVEILAYSGFDGVIFDGEHFSYDADALENLIRTAEGAGVTPLVKLPYGENTLLLRALDSGVLGVHFGAVDTPDRAEECVRRVKYHPLGDRSLSFSHRAARYRFVPHDDYLAQANEETLVVVVIESLRATENLDAILEVPGIDVVSVGRHDLSQSMGIPNQLEHPRMQAALSGIVRSARQREIPVGTWAQTVPMAAALITAGIKYIHWSDDLGIFAREATAISHAVRAAR